MFTLDSDLLGLLIALLTFFVPVLTSIMEKRKKKRKESVQEQDERDFLPDESSHNLHKHAPQVEEEELRTTAANELEELFNDILGINVQPHNVPDSEDHSVDEVGAGNFEGLSMEEGEAVGKMENE